MNKLRGENIFRNVSYNLVANFFTAIFVFISLPLYSKLMSNDNFGIFSFLFTLLLVFRVFDFGLSQTVTRYISKNYNLDSWQSNSRSIIAVCEIFFVIVFFAILFFFLKFENFIIFQWIKYELPQNLIKNISNEITYIFVIFSIIFTSKLIISVYRGVLYAIGEQPFFNISRFLFEFFNLIFGVLLVLLYDSLLYLFYFNLIISLIEMLMYRIYIRKYFLNIDVYSIRRGIQILYKNKNYAINIAFSSFIWLIASNVDKLYFVNISNLDIYGAYIIIVNFSIIPLFLFVPIYESSFPNLNNIYHKKDLKSFYFLLNLLISFSSVIFFIFLILCEIFSEVFWAYLFDDINKQSIANNIFFNFLFGYFLLSFSYIIFTFLKIKGKMKSHTILSVIWGLAILILFYNAMVKNSDPILYSNYWLLINFLFFIVFLVVNLFSYSDIRSILSFTSSMIPSFVIFIIIYFIALDVSYVQNNLFVDLFYLIIFSFILLVLFILLIKDLRIFLINFIKKKFFKYNENL